MTTTHQCNGDPRNTQDMKTMKAFEMEAELLVKKYGSTVFGSLIDALSESTSITYSHAILIAMYEVAKAHPVPPPASPPRKRHVVMTPINLHKPSNPKGKVAKQDYLKEQHLFTTGGAQWDDSKYNKAVIGDVFAFVNQTVDHVEIFKIVGIKEAANRREHWNIEDHKTRQVLVLSKKITNMTWGAFKEKIEYKAGYQLVGTTRTAKGVQLP